MRLATLARDSWELASGEERHREAPERFWLPPHAQRASLTRGQDVKLIFQVEGVDEDGSTAVQGERMWVLVLERRANVYIGMLDNAPALVEGGDDYYLVRGAEIAFGPEHVIDIASPPAEYLAERLAEPVTRTWPPDEDDPADAWPAG